MCPWWGVRRGAGRYRPPSGPAGLGPAAGDTLRAVPTSRTLARASRRRRRPRPAPRLNDRRHQRRTRQTDRQQQPHRLARPVALALPASDEIRALPHHQLPGPSPPGGQHGGEDRSRLHPELALARYGRDAGMPRGSRTRGACAVRCGLGAWSIWMIDVLIDIERCVDKLDRTVDRW